VKVEKNRNYKPPVEGILERVETGLSHGQVEGSIQFGRPLRSKRGGKEF